MMESWNIPVYDKKRELLIIGSEKSALINYLTPSEYIIFDTKIKSRTINDQIILEKEDNQVSKVIIDYKEPLREEKTQADREANRRVTFKVILADKSE